MNDNKKSLDYKLVKIAGFSANKKYMYCDTIPEGQRISVAVKKDTRTDFIGYMADETDSRYAPKGSVVALYDAVNAKDDFYIASWAKTVSKKPESESVIVTPATVSPVMQIGNNKTQVLARLLDPAPSVASSASLRKVCAGVLKSKPAELGIPGNRGFILRVGIDGTDQVESATFKGLPNTSPEQIVAHYLGSASNNPSPAGASLLNTINQLKDRPKSFIEVLGFTDSPVFNYGNSKNDEKLANTPNFRLKKGTQLVPTFSNAAITIEKHGEGRILKVTALPDKKIVTNQHGYVGAHDKSKQDNSPYLVPTKVEPSKTAHTYPVSIELYVDASNKQYNSIIVKVKPDAPLEVHERVMSALSNEPRKGAEGYFFSKEERKQVESALSDLAGTPALYTTSGTLGGQKHVFIAGRTNEPEFKNKIESYTEKYEIKLVNGGLYAIPEAKSIAALTDMAELFKTPAQSKLQNEYTAKKPPASKSKPKTSRMKYDEWLDSVYHQSAQKIAQEFDAQLSEKAKEAGIDWDNSKSNIVWPQLDGASTSIGTTANVKPENPADNGSCYINVSFDSWKTQKGQKQYGIVVSFRNLNKDREASWTYASHKDTYSRYSSDVWGSKSTVEHKKLSAEEIAAEQAKQALIQQQKLTEKTALASAQKQKAFNYFTSLPAFSGSHRGLESKQLPHFADLVDAKKYTLKNSPDNKAFAFAAFDIHERFVGYQFITEEKLLLNKSKPEKKNSWSNKMFNSGFAKDDARTGLPLGSHRTLGELDPAKPDTIYYSEGWANAASNFEVTGKPCVICFDKENMKKVIGLFSKKYPNHTHVHVADNDLYKSKNGNVGVMSALECAYNFGAQVVIPDVTTLNGWFESKFTDTSDFFVNNERDALRALLSSPLDYTDTLYNHILRVIHCPESKIDHQIATLARLCKQESVSDKDTLALVSEALNLRTAAYEKVENGYKHKYHAGFQAEHLASLVNSLHTSSNPAEKIDYEVVDKGNDTHPTNESPIWNVQVKAIPHPQKPNGTLTEIKDLSGENMEFIAKKLEALKTEFFCDRVNNRYLAPYKYINLINSGLSGVTGAPKFYAGKSRNDPNKIVIRGDFSSEANIEELESVLNPLGIKYSEEEVGYVVPSASTYVYIKESLIESFTQVNPDAVTVAALDVTEEQERVSSAISQVAKSFGFTRKDVAKQQVKLNQHNPAVGQLFSPIVAAIYLKAENKVAGSEVYSTLSAAEKVYTQQKAMQTLLKSLHSTNPVQHAAFNDDVQQALSLLAEQMPPTPTTPTNDNAISGISVSESSSQPSALENDLSQMLVKGLDAGAYQDSTYQDTPVTSITLQQQIASFQGENIEQGSAPTLGEEHQSAVEQTSIEVETVEVESPSTPHRNDYEVRLESLVDFAQVYLGNEYTPEEVVDALREPGSPYYCNITGYQFDMLRDDLKKIHTTPYGEMFNLPKRVETPFTLIAGIESNNVQNRIAQLDVFIDAILESNPNMVPKRISPYAIKGSYNGVRHPYLDEEGEYNKELIKSDLAYIDGNEDITTLTGYFAHRQSLHLIDQQSEFVSDIEESQVDKQAALAASMPAPTSTALSSKNKPDDSQIIDIEPPQELVRATVSETQVNAEAIIVDNNNSDYDNLYILAVTCAKELMSYEEFYDAVFKADGFYFNQNPFVDNEKLNKSEVVKALVPNGFKSPKSFYDSAFKDTHGKDQEVAQLSRVVGIVPQFIDDNAGIGEQFEVIDTLINNATPISFDEALEVTKRSFSSWYANTKGVTALNDIFIENLNLTTPEELATRYSEDEVKLLADSSATPIKEGESPYEVASRILTRWKVRQELVELDLYDFQELPEDEQHRIADTLEVPHSPLKSELAKNVFRKAEEIKQRSQLRLAQYGYIKAAITVENKLGRLPSFVYKQLDSLLSNEVKYKQVIASKVNDTENAMLQNKVKQAHSYISRISDSQRRKAILEVVPGAPTMIGVDNADKVGLGTFKYLVTEGEAANVPKPHHMTSFALYGENQLLAPSAFSLVDMRNCNLQPISHNAVVAALSDSAQLYEKQGYVSFTTGSGLFGVIHKDNTRSVLRIVDTAADTTDTYKESTYEEALERALDFFPVSSIEFTDGFSAEMAPGGEYSESRNIKSLDAMYQALIDTSADDAVYTELNKEIANDILDKAKEVGIELPPEPSDSVLECVSLIEQVKDFEAERYFNSIINTQDVALQSKYESLCEYISELVETQIDKAEQETLVSDEDLLMQLSESALRDLNSTLSIEPEAFLVRDAFDASHERALSADEKAEADKELAQLVDGIESSDNFEIEVIDEELETEQKLTGDAHKNEQDLGELVASIDSTELDSIVVEDQSEHKTSELEADALINAFFEKEGIDVAFDDAISDKALAHSLGADNSDVVTTEEGAIVLYPVGHNYKFGYVERNAGDLIITKYEYQDRLSKLESLYPGLVVTGKDGEKKTLVAMSREEIKQHYNDTGSTGNPRVDKILSKLANVAALSVKDLKLLAELTGVSEPNNGIAFASELTPLINDYFRANQIAQLPPEMATDEDIEFLKSYFNDENALDNMKQLSAELSRNSSERIVEYSYSKALELAKDAGIEPKLFEHPNNTEVPINLDDAQGVMPVRKEVFFDALSTPANVLQERASNSDLTEQTLIAALAPAVQTKFEPRNQTPVVDALVPQNTSVYYLHNGLVKQSELTSPLLEGQTEISVTGGLSIPLSDATFDISEVDAETDTLVEQGLKDTERAQVNGSYKAYSIGEDAGIIAKLATIQANEEIRRTLEEIAAEVKVPDGYELSMTKKLITIENANPEKDNDLYNAVGEFATTAELNKAIRVAKREVFGVQNDKSHPLRSNDPKTSEAVLPEPSQGAGAVGTTSELHPFQAEGNGSNDGTYSEADVSRSKAEHESHRELNSSGSDQPRGLVYGETDRITKDGVRLTPNIRYSYNSDVLGSIGKRLSNEEAYEVNLAAIKLAKDLTKEGREATADEKHILAKYRGWGGVSEILDEHYRSHEEKRRQLKELLSRDEYDSIQRSTLSAFYTRPEIVTAMWNALERMGCKGGLGLDPAFGIGNFASGMPESFADKVTLQAKELDPLTAEIAKHIHGPLVRNEGYEKSKIPSNTYDFAIGNVPFGNYKVFDKTHRDLSKFLIHDFFNLKTIEKVKPGGFVAFATSSGTLDKESDNVRKLLLEQADLVGAIRMPSNAFTENAGTTVNCDLLFFQVRHPEQEPAENQSWLNASTTFIPVRKYGYTQPVTINEYFQNNPEMVLGETRSVNGRFGKTTYVNELQEGQTLESELARAVSLLPEGIHFDFDPPPKEGKKVETLSEQTDGQRLGSYQLNSNGDVAIVMEKFEYNSQTEQVEATQILEPVELKPRQIGVMKSLIKLRDATKNHINLMLSELDDAAVHSSMSNLNKDYDEFIKNHGPVNKQANKNLFKGDPDSALVLGLEKWDKKTKKAEKADIFSERTVHPRKEITHVDNVEDAVIISLSEHGEVRPAYIEQITSKEWPNIVAELGSSIFLNPETNSWEHASTYLSGHVYNKLEAAIEASGADELYKHNVEHLEAAIPNTIPYYEIRAKLGSSWIPASDVQDFTKFLITGENEPCSPSERDSKFKVAKVKGFWELDISQYAVSVNSGRTSSEYGTNEWPTNKLLYAILNNKSIVVHGTDNDGKKYIKSEETAEANAKADLIKETFKNWLWEDKERCQRLESSYNRKVNGFVEPTFDGSKIEIEGLSSTLKGKAFAPREKQLNAIMRYLVTGRALFLHDVGVGKSFALLGSIIKGKQVGKHSKAMLAVPNSVFPQMQDLALSHFPNAKILMLDAKKLNKENRETALAQVATNNWDAVIIPHSIAERIDVPDDYKKSIIESELQEVRAAIGAIEDKDYNASRSIKGYQKQLENAKAKIEARLEDKESYNTANIAEMGIDALFVDEVDEFVNLDKVTNMSHVAGVNIRESKKARSLYYLTQYLHDQKQNQGIVLATGTDIRNNIADQYTLLRYLAPDILREQDIEMFDDFIGTFGEIQTKFEIAPEGTGFIEKTRLTKFYNLPELSMLYRQVADVVNAEQANIVRPNITEVNEIAEPSETMSVYMGVLAERAQGIRNGHNTHDNLLAITNAGKKAAIDMRFIDERLPDEPGSKLNMCVNNVLKEYHENIELNPSQIIFSDIGVPNSDGRFDLYNDIKEKLVAGGIPEYKVVFARDYKTDAKKNELQEKMNSGDIAVTIGSTENMGVGKNVQERLAAIHDLSIPWRVRDLEQRGGRIERFGNIFENATRYKYTTKDSFDLFIWQKLKQKALFAAQTKLSPRDAAREFDEEIEPSYGEVMAIATGNPLIQESIELEAEVDQLGMLQRSYHREKASREAKIDSNTRTIEDLKNKLVEHRDNKKLFGEFDIKVLGRTMEHIDAAPKQVNKMIQSARNQKTGQTVFEIGSISGSKLSVITAGVSKKFGLMVESEGQKKVFSEAHNMPTLLDGLNQLEKNYLHQERYLDSQIGFYEKQLTSLQESSEGKFLYATRLIEAKQRLTDVQREIATMAEAQAEEKPESPEEAWDNLLAELNQQGILSELRDFDDPHADTEKELAPTLN